MERSNQQRPVFLFHDLVHPASGDLAGGCNDGKQSHFDHTAIHEHISTGINIGLPGYIYRRFGSGNHCLATGVGESIYRTGLEKSQGNSFLRFVDPYFYTGVATIDSIPSEITGLESTGLFSNRTHPYFHCISTCDYGRCLHRSGLETLGLVIQCRNILRNFYCVLHDILYEWTRLLHWNSRFFGLLALATIGEPGDTALVLLHVFANSNVRISRSHRFDPGYRLWIPASFVCHLGRHLSEITAFSSSRRYSGRGDPSRFARFAGGWNSRCSRSTFKKCSSWRVTGGTKTDSRSGVVYILFNP